MKKISLKPEYFPTVFRGIKLETGWLSQFAVITAWNPDGEVASNEENEAANAELESMLKEKGLQYSPMTGFSPDGSHEEVGYLVRCSKEESIGIGQHFSQDAVFWIDNDQLIIASCNGEDPILLGSWRDRFVG